MKTILSSIVMILLFAGCTSLKKDSKNPFNDFSVDEIDRILICFEETIYGPGDNDNLDEPYDFVSFAQFYLKPSCYSIKDPKTISKLYQSIKGAKKTSGYTFSGILSYQVYLDKNGKVLIATHIVNHNCCVAFSRCYLKDGWIHFSEEYDLVKLNVNSSEYCRIIYDFMKKHLPKKIEDLDEFYKKRGGLEKQLFNKK